MNNIVIKHYRNYMKVNGGIPIMFNPYNESEIKDIAPTLTCNCGHWDSSATVLILEEDNANKVKRKSRNTSSRL